MNRINLISYSQQIVKPENFLHLNYDNTFILKWKLADLGHAILSEEVTLSRGIAGMYI